MPLTALLNSMGPFLDAMKNGVIVSDSAGKILYANPACEILFGYAVSDLKKMNVREITPETIRAQHDQFIGDYIKTGDKKIIGIGRQLEARHRDGHSFPIHLSVSETTLSDQRIFIGEIMDMREHQRQMLELNWQKTLLIELADTIPALAARVDGSKRYRLVNKTFETWLRKARSTAVNQTVEQALGPVVYRALQKDIETAMSGQEVVSEKAVNYPGTGVLTVRTHYTPLFTPEGQPDGYIVHATDISDLKRLETELRQAKQRAEDANNSKSEFIQMLAHDIRGPLNVISGYSQLVGAAGLTLDEQSLKNYTDNINWATQFVVDYVEDLLEVGRIETGSGVPNLERFGLDDLIRSALELVQFTAKEREVKVTYQPEVIGLQATTDKRRLTRVLLNLVSNAIKYSPTSGEVRIAIDLEKKGILLTISDNGPGMSKAVQERLGQPFELFGNTALDGSTGVGLGFFVAKSLTESLGGRLEVDSKKGCGTTIHIHLPCKTHQSGR